MVGACDDSSLLYDDVIRVTRLVPTGNRGDSGRQQRQHGAHDCGDPQLML